MHHDRNNGSWSELKAKRYNKFDDEPLSGTDVDFSQKHSQLDKEIQDVQNIKKEVAARQFARLKKMFKNTANYDTKQDRDS